MLPLTNPISIVLTVLAVTLLAPLLLNRLRIPYIIGLIAAGMALGPYGFGVLEYGEPLRVFGEVGLLYLMFLAGVEIDMYHLRHNYRRGIVFGLLTFALPMATGVGVAFCLPGTGLGAALLVGVMFASHTLLTYPIVNRFGLSRTPAVVISVCGTIVAVLLALIVLAEVVQARAQGGFRWNMTLLLTAKLALYAVGWRYLAPWLTRLFMRKVTDGVLRFVYILGMVLVMSLTAQLVGVASILGAFYAGLVLNRFIPARSVLMRRTEFAGNAIFIPWFLIGVGMVIDVRSLVQSSDTLIAALALTVAAIASKWIAAKAGARLLRLDGTEGGLLFGLTSGKAAATIATTMVGYQYGILDETMLNAAVVMILGCCIVASLSTQRSAVRLRMRLTDEEHRSAAGRRDLEARPMVAVANPVTSEGLMKLTALAKGRDDHVPTVLLFVANSDDPMHLAMGETSLRNAADAATIMDLDVETVLRYDVNTAAGIVNAMKERRCNQLILGLHRPATGFDSFLGGMEEKILRATNRMIVFTRLFIPVNTVGKLVVAVPENAQYETGLWEWAAFIAHLTAQLGAPLEVMAPRASQPLVAEALKAPGAEFDMEFLDMESWDDFIILSSRVADDDLLVTLLARHGSISYGPMVEQLPAYLNRYFRRHNLLVIYPEQFGSEYSQHPASEVNAVAAPV